VRIVHIADCYLPRLGGIEVQVDGLARAQQAQGHEVHIVTATRVAHAVDPEIVDGVQIHRYGFPLPADLPLHPRSFRILKHVVTQFSPDVVHVHVGSVSLYSWSGIRAARSAGFPVVTTVQSIWGPLARRLFWCANLVLRWSRWTVLSAVSAAAAEPVALAASVRREAVFVTSNGVDLAGWSQADASAQPAAQLRLVSATRFAPRKRVLPLIEMMAKLRDSLGSQCPTLTIAGNGPAWERARRRVRQLGLEHVVSLPGRLDRQALAHLYAASDVFVQLSVRESFGLAAIEARASGLPVLGRQGNGFSEFITPGTDGYLEQTDAGVRARIVDLAEKPQLLAELRAYAVRNPPSNTWEHALEQVNDAYEAALLQRLR